MRRAFTVIELLIVVLVIGILLAIAVPNWMKTRDRSRAMQCVATLKRIADAKELYAHENSVGNGAPVTMANIYPDYFRAPSYPTCSGGGTYTVGNVGTSPTCSLSGLNPPHVLP